jgi:phosphoglucosamine mutase
VVFPDFGTTGDGILTGLKLMARMARTRRTLADLASVITTVPQVLINVPVSDKSLVATATEVREAVVEAERVLGDSGRVLLRPSGTESLVRVMVEATDPVQAQQLADDLAKRVASI